MASIDQLEGSRSRPTLRARWRRGPASAFGSGDARAHRRVERYLRLSFVAQRVLAAAALVVAAPLIAFLILLVRCTSPGPAIYRQVRVGRDGTHFTLYKLRTMRVDAERETGAVWAQPNDPRITPLGAVMRRLHLDELPQLWNVVRGDMALIGPRPERPEFTAWLVDRVPDYAQRWRVPPGITGLAQVNLPSDVDVAGVSDKVRIDLDYIRTAGPALDAAIVAYTTLKLVGAARFVPLRWLGLDRRARA